MAIPTIGPRGIRYRSRLEARWAYTFDAMKWEWQYEPLDLSGYIPDFIVTIGGRRILFEVKGTLAAHERGVYAPHVAKILRSGWDGYYVVVGSDPTATLLTPVVETRGRSRSIGEGSLASSVLTEKTTSSLPVIGVLGHTTYNIDPGPCTVGIVRLPPATEARTRSPGGSVTGSPGGSPSPEVWVLLPKRALPTSYDRFSTIWTDAQNLSQWRAPSSTPPQREDLNDLLDTPARPAQTQTKGRIIECRGRSRSPSPLRPIQARDGTIERRGRSRSPGVTVRRARSASPTPNVCSQCKAPLGNTVIIFNSRKWCKACRGSS